MNERAKQLHDQAEAQIVGLNSLLAIEESALMTPCEGREALSDGTVGGVSMFIADNYLRISDAVRNVTSGIREMGSRHSIPRRTEHQPPEHRRPSAHGVPHATDDTPTGSVTLGRVIERLAVARGRLGLLAELSDPQLDSIPPSGAARFADGKRTLEQIIQAMLKHQRRLGEAVEAALAHESATQADHDRSG